MAGVTRKLWKQLQRVAPVMPRAKTTGGFGAWECVWWLSVHSYAGEAPCSRVLPPASYYWDKVVAFYNSDTFWKIWVYGSIIYLVGCFLKWLYELFYKEGRDG